MKLEFMICQKVGPLGGQAETIRWKARGRPIALATSVREERRGFRCDVELGARFIPGETLPARPTQLSPPPLVSREKRIDGSGFRCGMVIYLGGFFLFFSNWMFFTFSTTIPSNLKIEFLRHRLRAKGINKGEKLTPRLALAEKLFQLGSEEGKKGEEEEEERKHGYSARFE